MAEDRKRFLQQAEEAEANAAKAADPDVKRQFLEIAAKWRGLASRAPGPPGG
jgi:hypothetical protein